MTKLKPYHEMTKEVSREVEQRREAKVNAYLDEIAEIVNNTLLDKSLKNLPAQNLVIDVTSIYRRVLSEHESLIQLFNKKLAVYYLYLEERKIIAGPPLPNDFAPNMLGNTSPERQTVTKHLGGPTYYLHTIIPS